MYALYRIQSLICFSNTNVEYLIRIVQVYGNLNSVSTWESKEFRTVRTVNRSTDLFSLYSLSKLEMELLWARLESSSS